MGGLPCNLFNLFNLLLVFLLSFPNASPAAEPDLYRPVFHAARYSDRQCLEMAGLSPSSTVSSSRLAEGLTALFTALASEGYPLARLDSAVIGSDAATRSIDIYIGEGEPLFVGEGSTFLSPGKRLREIDLIRQAERLLDDHNDRGFPFARITVLPDVSQDSVGGLQAKVEFAVEPGPFIRIGGLSFPGAVHTRSGHLALESRLRRRDVFTQSAVRRAVRRLDRLSYIDVSGGVSVRTLSPGTAEVTIPVAERRVNYIQGVASAAAGTGQLAGEFRMQLGNLFGAGRRLSFEWLALNPDRQGVRAAYREPWILGQPVHLGAGFEQWREDTLGAATRLKFTTEWEALDRLLLSGSVENEAIGRETASDGVRTLWLEGGVDLNRFDRDWNPRTGWRFRVASARGKRRVSDGSSPYTLRRESSSMEAVNPISSRWVVWSGISLRDISGRDLIPEDLLRLGGRGTVRGYAEERIFARGAAWGSLELRWCPDREAYAGLFADAGRVYRADSRIAPLTRTPLGFGITAGMDTRAGRLGLDLGLARGESPGNARVHVQLESAF